MRLLNLYQSFHHLHVSLFDHSFVSFLPKTAMKSVQVVLILFQQTSFMVGLSLQRDGRPAEALNLPPRLMEKICVGLLPPNVPLPSLAAKLVVLRVGMT